MRIKPFSIELSDEAEIDFDNAYEFYYQNNSKIADNFFKTMKLVFENIK